MHIKIISYGHKFYEAEGKPAPYHDFLFSLRDLINPYWVPELKEYCGKDQEIIRFFEKDQNTISRLEKVESLVDDFVKDFLNNQHRTQDCSLTFAFKCTGGKHRSVYFAETIYKKLTSKLKDRIKVEIEHVDLARHTQASC
jgi:RNase adapter protein RapZ